MYDAVKDCVNQEKKIFSEKLMKKDLSSPTAFPGEIKVKILVEWKKK